jgi:DNA mismatch endonuclease (patch repair protein)
MSVSRVRSSIMKSVRRQNTGPELIVRRCLHGLGLRFRLHRKDLPGSPDIVLPRYRIVIFVHGCFWHRHQGCKYSSVPKTRQEYWLPKFAANVERDRLQSAKLQSMGWKILVIWGCETRDGNVLRRKLESFFNLSSDL